MIHFLPPLQPPWLKLAGILTSVAIWFAGFCEISAQTPPRIVSSAASGGTLKLTWSGDAVSYSVQSTPSLSAPNWQPLLLTAQTNTVIPLPGASGFFRVTALTTPEAGIDDAARFQVLDAIDRKIESLPGTDGPADSRELAAFLSGFSEFIGAGATEDTSVWARFRDGRLVFIIINNRPPATEEELEQIARLTPTAPALQGKATVQPNDELPAALQSRVSKHFLTRITRPTGIPESRNAVVFQASGVGLTAPMLERLVPTFRAHGYQVQGGEAGLFDLMNIEILGDDIGAFYIDTHGLEIGGVIPFAMLTSTVADQQTDTRVKANFERGEIAYGFLGPRIRPKDGRGIIISPKPLYCLLPPFVSNHWKFGRNSLVYMDVCDSASPNAAPFIEACANAGASVYAGWTDSVDDYWALFAAKVFFDTSMGDNAYFKLAVPTRPFDLIAIKRYMAERRFDISPKSNAELVFLTGLANGAFGILAPSIYSMNVDESKGELRIVGLFDPEVPATVRVEGNATREIAATPQPNPNPLHPWQIIYPLPAQGQPSAGNVTVIQRGRRSNTVPLTEWRISARGERWFAPGTPQPSSTVDFQLHFRADVHRARATPYQEPVFFGASAGASQASSARVVSTSGVYRDPLIDRTVEWLLPSPVDLSITYTGFGSVDRAFYGTMTILRDGNVDLTFISKAANTMTIVETLNGPDGRKEVRSPADPFVRTFPPVKTKLDFANYTIQSGSGPAAGEAGVFNWQAASASFPPDEKLSGYGALGSFDPVTNQR